MKTTCLIFIMLTCSLCLYGGAVENARNAKGTTVIKCSPNGANGGQIPLKALNGLKKGMTLMLLPGQYESDIVVVADKIIITSNQTGKCEVSVKIKGNGCIVKDIWLHSINADGNTIVVDSIMDRFRSGERPKRKLDHFLYNTCIGRIRTSWRDTKFKLQNCTVVSTYDAIDCGQFSKWDIENCILYSTGTVFRFEGYGNKKCKLALRDNLIFGKTSIGKKDYTNSKSELNQALNLKDLKKMGRVALLGKNIIEQPVFVQKITQDEDAKWHSDNLKPDAFKLTPDSPGQGKGVVIAEHPYFKKKTVRKSTIPEEPIPETEKKKGKSEWDKEWAKISKKSKKDKEKENSNDNYGGVPGQPK